MKSLSWNDLRLENIPDMKEFKEYNRLSKLTADRDYF